MSITSNKLKSPLYAELERHDTGWVACSDWTQSKFGDTFGNDVVHNFDTPLSHLLVTFLISPTGADDNCWVAHLGLGTTVSEQTGLSLVAVDNNSLYFRSGLNGIRYTHPTGTLFLLSTSSWYYKIVVTKPQGVVPITNRSINYSTSETDTGKNWIDGKRIYRKCFSGTSTAAAIQYVVSGIVPDNVTKLEYIQKTAINTVLFPGSEFTTGGLDQVWATWLTATHGTNPNSIYLYHNDANAQSQPYYIIMEYTV